MKMHLVFFNALMLATSSPVHADNGWFEGRDVDYWNEEKWVTDSFGNKQVQTKDRKSEEKSEENTKDLPITDSIIRSADFLPFNWNDYTNPLSAQFWDDGGNYVPPRPLRMVAANPTKENVEKYLAWQKRKMEVNRNLSSILTTSGDVSDNASLPEDEKTTRGSRGNASQILQRSRVVWNQVKISFFYRSSCPFCRKEMDVIKILKSKGAKISSYQLQAESEPPLFSNSVPVGSTEANRLDINVTPTTFIYAKGKTLKLEGFMALDDLDAEVSKLF